MFEFIWYLAFSSSDIIKPDLMDFSVESIYSIVLTLRCGLSRKKYFSEALSGRTWNSALIAALADLQINRRHVQSCSSYNFHFLGFSVQQGIKK